MQKAENLRHRSYFPKVSLPHRLARLLMLCLVPQLAFQAHPLLANPTGATVAGGTAAIDTVGNTMTITTSDRAVIHWQGFSIGAGETTQFVQPSSSSAVLNRVTSGDASHLLGTLQANGQVYLLNPNGVFIGNGAVINVGSFLATTANIADTDFMKGGNLTFSGATDAAIINEGSITATAGDVFLLARTVKNTETGVISAPKGTVGLGAGNQFYLKKDEIGAMQVEVKAEAVPGFKGETGVDNAGLLQAMRVQMEADGNLYGLAINQQGLVRATGVSRGLDGTIVLSAPGGMIRQSGTMLAVNADGSGGRLSISGKDISLTASSLATAAGAVDGGQIKIEATGDTLVSGRLSVDGAIGKAGRIQLTGNRVGLLDAEVTADGAKGGGEVLVGGDYLGMNPSVPNAKATVMDQDSVISADATITGDGGKVILWSDEYTGFYGDISAQGGSVSGNGGFIETSGKINLQAMGSVTTLAANGKSGLWLLDPADLTIDSVDDNITAAPLFEPVDPDLATSTLKSTTLRDALESGNVEIRTTAGIGTGTGLITFADWSTPNITANRTMTVTSVGGITVNNGITIVADSNDTHALSVIFSATGAVSFNGTASLDLNGGSFTSSGTTFTLGAGSITTTAQANSVIASGAIGLTHSGNVVLGGNLVTTGANHNNGVGSAGGAVTITATGAATIQVDGNITTSGGNNGDNTTTGGNAGSVTFNTDNQNIILDGTTITATGGSGDTRGLGGTITFSDQVLLQTAATTLISGTTGVAGGASILFNSTLNGGQNLTLTAGTGNITFTGAVGTTRLGAVTVSSGATVQALSTFRAASLTQSAGTVATTLSGLVDLTGALDFTGQILNLNGVGANVVGTTMDVTNAGLFTTANGANLTVGNEFVQDGAGLVQLGGDLASTSDGFSFATGVALNNGITITTGLLAGDDIQFSGTLDGTQTLSLTAGAGNITFTGAVGTTVLGAVTINAANNVGITSTFQATSFNQAAVGAGTFTLGGALTATTGNVTIQSATVTLNAVVEATLGDISLRQTTGTLDLDVAGGLVAGGNNINLFARDINLTQAFGDSSDVITLTALDNRTIGVGATAGDLTLDGDELQKITGSSLELITTGAGTITVNNISADNSNNVGTVILNSTGDVSFSTTASIFNAVTAESDASVNVSVAITTDTGAISLTGATGIQLGSNLTTSGGNVGLFSATTLTGAVLVNTTDGGNTLGADINFGASLGGAFDLELNAGTGGAITGTSVNINDLTLSNGASVSFTGAMTVNDLITTANSYTLSLTGTGNTFTQNVDFLNTGEVTLGNESLDTFLFNGGLSFAGNAAGNLAATIISPGVAINFGTGGVTMIQKSTVDTTNEGIEPGADITLGGAVAGTGLDLSLTAGLGNISVAGPVGSDLDPLGDLTIASDGTVTFNGTLDLGRFIQTGTGSTTFNANLQTGLGFAFTGNQLKFATGSGDNTIGGGMTISNTTGDFILEDSASLSVAGIFDQNGPGDVILGGDVFSQNSMTFAGAVSLTSDVTLQNNTGNIELEGAVLGAKALTIEAAAGTVTFGGVVGATPLASLTVSGAGIEIDTTAITTTGAQSYTGAVTLADNTTLTTTDSDVTFQVDPLSGIPTTISGAKTLTIDAGTGTVTFGGGVGTGGLTALTSLDVTGGTIAINGGGVTTSGAQSYTGAVELGDDATLTTTDSDVTFSSTIENALAQALTIDAGTGTVTLGGALGSGTALSSLEVMAGTILINGGAVTTTGAQTYTGAVNLGAALTTLTTTGGKITLDGDVSGAGEDLNLNTGAGDIEFTGAVGSDLDPLGNLTIASDGAVSFAGTLDIGGFIQTGAGSTTFNANLQTGAGFSFTGDQLTFAAGSGNNVIGSDMTVSNTGAFTLAPGATLASAGIFDQNGAGAVSLGGDVFSAGAMTFAGGITLTAAVELETATAGANIDLQNTVMGAFDLTVTSAGTVTFGGALGGVGTELTSLAVTGTTIAINGGSVRTSGDQIYTGPVTLGATTTMNAGAGQINFSETLNPGAGFTQLFVTGAGAVNFGGAVGGIIAFSDLSVSATTIAIDGALVRNLGTQQYTGAVTLGTDTVLYGSVITFNGTVSGGGNSLAIDGHLPFGMGNAVFNDLVSGLASLSVARNTTINTTGITTTGAQTYNGAVTLGVDTTLTTADSDVTFAGTGAGTISGGKALTIDAGMGTVTFGGGVGTGGLTALTSLDVTGATIAINGGGVRTQGLQSYTGAVTLGDDTTLTTTANGNVAFVGTGSTINNAQTLTISAHGTGTVTFGGAVGDGAELTSLAVTGSSIGINGGSVRTLGNQSYTGPVSLGAATTLTTTDSNVTFNGTATTLSGAQALTITAGTGTVTFGGGVGTGGLTALDSLAVTGGTIAINGGGVRTDGAAGQVYTGAVALGAATTLTTSGDLVTFSSTIQNATARALTIAAGVGTVTFGDTVGAGTALASLAVTGNTIAINGGSVRTSGNQGYTGAVTLGAATTLTTTANGNVAFSSTIRNTGTARALTITTGTGSVTFGNSVGGGGTALSSLAVTAGAIAIQGASMTTSGAGGQTYTGVVTAGAVTFAAGTGNINLSNSANDFTGLVRINGAGGVTLRDANALAIGQTTTTGGQVFVAAGTITSTEAKSASGSNILIQSTGGGVTLGAGSTYSSSLTQMVVAKGRSFLNNAGSVPFTGTTQIFTDKASLNNPSTPNAGLTGFQPAADITPSVTISSQPGAYTLTAKGNLPSGDVVTYLPIFPNTDLLTPAELNNVLSTDANLTTIPVASAAVGIFLPSLNPVSFGAVLPAKPAANNLSGGSAPIRISFRGEKEKEL